MTPHERPDRRLAAIIFCSALLVLSYFFQGDGWAHHAHYSTIRALVEARSFEITRFHDKTGDVAFVDGHVYSNKPPGLALLGTIPYVILSRVSHDDQLNQRLITIVLCAIPCALTTVLLFFALQREGATARVAAMMALAFAYGSLLLPYSGMIYNHALVAACVFAAFVIRERVIFASMLLGLACLSEYIIFPLMLLFVALELFEHRSLKRVAILSAGPALALAAMLTYQHVVFGSALSPSYAHENESFRERAFGAARFHLPDIRVLYWITWHRMRGLFYCCPIFVLPLVSMPYTRRRPAAHHVFALSVVGFFTVLLMCYEFWTGGYGVGPRFAIPALPFLFLFARRAFEKLPWLAWILIALSVFNMLAVTSVWAEYPANESGPPEHWDPIGATALDLLRGRVARPANSTNLGLALGLHGTWSVAPAIGLIVIAFAAVFLLTRERRSRGFEVIRASAA